VSVLPMLPWYWKQPLVSPVLDLVMVVQAGRQTAR
jgi:hypothetical protein